MDAQRIIDLKSTIDKITNNIPSARDTQTAVKDALQTQKDQLNNMTQMLQQLKDQVVYQEKSFNV